MAVVRVEDHGVVPVPAKNANYGPNDVGPLRTDLKPLEISQPDGPSFTVEGNLVRWQKWQFRVGFTPREGSGAAHRRLGGGRPRAADPVPGGDVGHGRAVWRPNADAPPQEHLRRRRAQLRGAGQLADARLRLPGRDLLLRRGAGRSGRHGLHGQERDLHARGGLRRPLAAREHAHTTRPRCGARAGW